MINIVSGYFRSGTSAMMQALIAGGMPAAYSDARNAVADQHSDAHYHPNPAGLYEVPLREYGGLDFPLQYQGKLIKVMLWGLDSIAVNPQGYRVVIMRREPEEIRQSYYAFFGRNCPPLNEYSQRIRRAEAMLSNRADVRDVAIIDYSLLCERPDFVFDHLSRVRDWPIDSVAAAAVIDPAQYRFRRELLTAGI